MQTRIFAAPSFLNYFKAPMTEVPQPPKRPMNAVFIYKNMMYKDYKAKHPEMSMGDITKNICAEYDKLSKADKEQYVKMAATAKDEYTAVGSF